LLSVDSAVWNNSKKSRKILEKIKKISKFPDAVMPLSFLRLGFEQPALFVIPCKDLEENLKNERCHQRAIEILY